MPHQVREIQLLSLKPRLLHFTWECPAGKVDHYCIFLKCEEANVYEEEEIVENKLTIRSEKVMPSTLYKLGIISCVKEQNKHIVKSQVLHELLTTGKLVPLLLRNKYIYQTSIL